MLRSSLPVACFSAVLVMVVTHGQTNAATAPLTALSPTSVRALRDTTPLFTEQQLVSGTELFAKVCVACHEPADYSGKAFKDKWNGTPMYDLYEYILTKMPDDAIGTLTPEQAGDALAYVLKTNGVQAGPNKIAPDTVMMRTIKLDFSPVSPSDAMKAKLDTMKARLDTMTAKVDTMKAKVDTMKKKIDTLSVRG